MGQFPGNGIRAGEGGFHRSGIPNVQIRREVKGDGGGVGLIGEQDLVALVHAAGLHNGTVLLGQLRSGGVKDHLHRAVIPGQHHARHSGLAGDVDGRTAPHHQPPLDGDVVQGELPFPQAVGKD